MSQFFINAILHEAKLHFMNPTGAITDLILFNYKHYIIHQREKSFKKISMKPVYGILKSLVFTLMIGTLIAKYRMLGMSKEMNTQ